MVNCQPVNEYGSECGKLRSLDQQDKNISQSINHNAAFGPRLMGRCDYPPMALNAHTLIVQVLGILPELTCEYKDVYAFPTVQPDLYIKQTVRLRLGCNESCA